MFFEKELLSFRILDVLELNQTDITIHNKARNFNALSYRIHADAQIKTASSVYHLTDGCVAYVPARLNYTRTADVDEMIVIHFDATDYHTDRIEYFYTQNPETFTALFREILDCWNRKEVGYQYLCSAILYRILALCHSENYKERKNASKIQDSVDYMARHFKDPKLSMEEIAKRSFMSQVYFRKLFREEYGISPKKYLINLRIQYAIGLISAGYYSLKEVASLSGYTDYKYFSVEFKKTVGVSPSEYTYNYPK